MLLCFHNGGAFDICMKKFNDGKMFLTKCLLNKPCFDSSSALTVKVHTRADQLVLQLLMNHFDTVPSQLRHIGHLHEHF